MTKNRCAKNYDITIVGGGLTGKLMLSVLTNCDLFKESKFCWINSDVENFNENKTPDYHSLFIRYEKRYSLKKSNLILFFEIWS